MISPALKHAVLILLTFSATSCGDNPSINDKMSYWTQQLSERVSVGTTKMDVDEYLKETGLEYSYLESEKHFYAIDREVRNRWLIYQAAVTIRIQLANRQQSGRPIPEPALQWSAHQSGQNEEARGPFYKFAGSIAIGIRNGIHRLSFPGYS